MTTTQQDDVLVYHLAGRLAVTGAPELEQNVLAAIDAGAQRLIFDFSRLEYVSSAGLRVVFVVLKRLGNDAGKLCFCGLNPAIQQIFEIAGMASRLRIVPTLDEAITVMKST